MRGERVRRGWWRSLEGGVTSCPNCNATTCAGLTTHDYNRRCSTESFHYARCAGCHLIWLQDPPPDLAVYYPPGYVPGLSPGRMARIAKKESYQVGHVLRHVRPGRLIEVGAGAGIFALQAKDAGFDVTAIEQDATSCRTIEDVVGARAVCSNEPARAISEEAPARAIALWQSLEHLVDPWSLLDAAADNLQGGGVLAIATPNPEAFSLKILGARWPHLDAPRHLWLFPLTLLTQRLRQAGLYLCEAVFEDRGAVAWNNFAWQRALSNLSSSRAWSTASFGTGLLIGTLLRPLELSERCASFTAIFRKPEQ